MNENIKIDFNDIVDEEYQYKLYENYITFPFYGKVYIIGVDSGSNNNILNNVQTRIKILLRKHSIHENYMRIYKYNEKKSDFGNYFRNFNKLYNRIRWFYGDKKYGLDRSIKGIKKNKIVINNYFLFVNIKIYKFDNNYNTRYLHHNRWLNPFRVLYLSIKDSYLINEKFDKKSLRINIFNFSNKYKILKKEFENDKISQINKLKRSIGNINFKSSELQDNVIDYNEIDKIDKNKRI